MSFFSQPRCRLVLMTGGAVRLNAWLLVAIAANLNGKQMHPACIRAWYLFSVGHYKSHGYCKSDP